jgi:hypothetical protein
MINFCFNDGAKAVDQDDFGLLLSAVEGEVVEGTLRGPVPIDYVPIQCDNQGALALAEHDTSHLRSKHIAIKYHLVREHAELQCSCILCLGLKM